MTSFKFLARPLAAMVLTLAAASSWAQPLEVEGVKLDATALVDNTALQLNGAGLRVKVFFKVYVAGLYVPQKASNAAQLLAQKGPRRIALTLLRNVDAESFANALNDGLRDNHTDAQLAALKPQIDTFIANLKAAGEAKKGDVVHLDFVPNSGTRVTVNGQVRGSAIAGEDFYTAVLRIWLGDKPVDGGLKKGLVGG